MNFCMDCFLVLSISEQSGKPPFKNAKVPNNAIISLEKSYFLPCALEGNNV
jgi:hypothetical protein